MPVGHVEGGLRSFNKNMPEKLNRIMTDHISTILFCPSETATSNLSKEGFTNIVNMGRRSKIYSPFSEPVPSPSVFNVRRCYV